MFGYELNNFKNQKAFVHFDGVINGKFDYGPRICINTKGEKLFELPNRNMIVNEFEREDVAFVQGENMLYALMNNKGEFLTDFIYNRICGGSEEGFFEAIRNGKHGHININGKEIITCKYDEGYYFSEGISAECLNGKWGMIDCYNNAVIPFEYEDIGFCKNNLINAKKNGKYGLINKFNEVIVDFLYDEINILCTRECLVYPALKGGKWGLLDRQGNIIEDFIYNDMQVISYDNDNLGEFIKIQKDTKYALYSAIKKTFLTDFIYDYVGCYSENRFYVNIDKKSAYIDTLGEVVLPAIFDDCDEWFNEGIAKVTKNDLTGAINLSGELIIPCQYTALYNCKEGLILAINEKMQKGYIDRNNMVVVPFGKYITCEDFHCGLAKVYSREHGFVYIDTNGEVLEIKV